MLLVEYIWVDEDGVAHTGPTTSPENSYEVYTTPDPLPASPSTTATTTGATQAFGVLGRAGILSSLNMQQKFQRSMNVQKPLRKFEFLTFSPAIDISVLRQVHSTPMYYITCYIYYCYILLIIYI